MQMRRLLPGITERGLNNNIKRSEHDIAAMETREYGCKRSIDELNETMKQTSGAGMGWLFFFLFGASAGLVLGLSDLLKIPESLVPIAAIYVFTSPFFGAVLGSRLSRKRQNQPYALKIEEKRREIDECLRELPSLNAQAEAWRQEKTKFAAWQAQLPAVSARTTQP